MKALRIVFSILAAISGVGLLVYAVIQFFDYTGSFMMITPAFIIVGITAMIMGFSSLSKKARVGATLMAPFILILIVETFNLFLILVSLDVIPIDSFPHFDTHYINRGLSTTSYIMSLCVPGIVFAALSKKGNLVFNLIAMIILLAVEGLIVGFNSWFCRTVFIIIWAVNILAVLNVLIFKQRNAKVQKIINEAKTEQNKKDPVGQNSFAKEEVSPKIKKKTWEEDGFTYSNLP